MIFSAGELDFWLMSDRCFPFWPTRTWPTLTGLLVAVAVLAMAVLVWPADGRAQDAERASPLPEAAAPADEADNLDKLFAELKRTSDPDEAKDVADRIWAEWRSSGSATIDLLMQWAGEAVEKQRFSTALDFLDQVIVLEPGFVEGWNRRATLHFMMNDYAKSMSDIDRVLALEPRHFGALSGMAAILSATGQERLAMRALMGVLDVYPANREAQKRVGELAEGLAGDPI